MKALVLIALLAGWVIDRARMQGEIGIESRFSWRVWCTSVRYLAPAAVLCVFLFNLLT